MRIRVPSSDPGKVYELFDHINGPDYLLAYKDGDGYLVCDEPFLGRIMRSWGDFTF